MDPEAITQETDPGLVSDPGTLLLALGLLLLGFVLARLASVTLARALSDPLGNHRTLVLQRVVTYGIAGLFAMSALHQVGIELSVLLGAAGLLTVAIGFAAQTAASNFVSGVFLLGERPFEVGETIQIAGTTGVVLSIDTLSIRLRTFDNLLVRIPNESVMKSEVVNYTRFPIRRHDLRFRVDPVVDLETLETVLLGAAEAPIVLSEPAPVVIFHGWSEAGLEVQLSAWALRENFLEMRNRLHRDVALALQRARIPLGYPNRIVELRDDALPHSPATRSDAADPGENS
ncbi:MAG: mechanosensitive ion channel family protein [bacterium]|nr:mechanosensitive ion channel family protein [bacterium]